MARSARRPAPCLFSAAALSVLRGVFRHLQAPYVRIEPLRDAGGEMTLLLYSLTSAQDVQTRTPDQAAPLHLGNLASLYPSSIIQGRVSLDGEWVTLAEGQAILEAALLPRQELVRGEPGLQLPWQEARDFPALSRSVVEWGKSQGADHRRLRLLLSQAYDLQPGLPYQVHLSYDRRAPRFGVFRQNKTGRLEPVWLAFHKNQAVCQDLGISEGRYWTEVRTHNADITAYLLSGGGDAHPIRTVTEHMIGNSVPTATIHCSTILTLPGDR